LEAGFEVENFQSDCAVISKLKEISPDLVIWDVAKEDGFEDISRMQREIPTPIIAVGKYPSRVGWVKAVDAGADLYLELPLGLKELVARIRSLLRRSPGTTENREAEPN
jgi:two-component system OmpR family response regulator